jgi:hypothetical protein
MHTDATLDLLSQAMISLGASLQDFREKTCTMFQTRELERERVARRRHQEKSAAKSGARSMPVTSSDNSGESASTANHRTGPTTVGASGNSTGELTNTENYGRVPASAVSSNVTRAPVNIANKRSEPTPQASNNARKPKLLNLNTYTYHSLGDYATTILDFGTTDSYSTQPVSLQLTS